MNVEMLLALVGAHWLADYPLQGDYLAKLKFQAVKSAEGTWCLTGHAAIQGLVLGAVVAAFGGNALLAGLAVFVTHWAIDFAKTRNAFGYSVDQFAHIAVALAVGVAFA